MQCRSQEVVEGFEDMEDVVKFIFGISGESVACSSSCVGIYIFGDFLVGFHLQSSVFLFCFRECHCSLSLPIPSVSTEVAPLYF